MVISEQEHDYAEILLKLAVMDEDPENLLTLAKMYDQEGRRRRLRRGNEEEEEEEDYTQRNEQL